MLAAGLNSRAPYFLPVGSILASIPNEDLAPLVSERSRRQIGRLVADLRLAVQTACYECRLSQSDDRVDLAACLFPDASEAAAGYAALRRKHEANPDWTRTLELLEAWSAPGSSLRGRIPFIWIAFDLDRELATLPSPCVGLCIDPAFFERRLGTGADGPNSADLELLADSFSRFFSGVALTSATKALLQNCLRAAGGVEPKHLSYMLGRPSAPFKLDVRLPVERVGQYLQEIGWPAPAQRVEQSIRQLMPWSGNVQLNLVLQPELSQPLEVEFMTLASEVSTADRASLLGSLVAAKLCSPEKAAVLLKLHEQAIGYADGQPIARGWYVKVRFIDGIASEAKAYVGLMPRPNPVSNGDSR
jgi:hypothetical protein